LIRSILEYASIAWNSFTITDFNKLERIRIKFSALCHNRLFQDMECHHYKLLERLNLRALHNSRSHFDVLLVINVFSGTKCCPSVLETVGLWVPTQNIRNFNMFTCSSSHCPSARCVSTCSSSHCPSARCVSTCSSSHCPSARYVSTANAVCKLIYIFLGILV
jgi:hypothetical protein